MWSAPCCSSKPGLIVKRDRPVEQAAAVDVAVAQRNAERSWRHQRAVDGDDGEHHEQAIIGSQSGEGHRMRHAIEGRRSDLRCPNTRSHSSATKRTTAKLGNSCTASSLTAMPPVRPIGSGRWPARNCSLFITSPPRTATRPSGVGCSIRPSAIVRSFETVWSGIRGSAKDRQAIPRHTRCFFMRQVSAMG